VVDRTEREGPASRHHDAALLPERQKELMKATGNVAAIMSGTYSVLLMCTLFLVIENIPGAKLPSLLSMLGTMGTAHNVPFTVMYTCRRYFNACLMALSTVLLLEQVVQIKASPYYSLMVDSSTDISREDHLLVYCQAVLVPRDAHRTRRVPSLCEAGGAVCGWCCSTWSSASKWRTNSWDFALMAHRSSPAGSTACPGASRTSSRGSSACTASLTDARWSCPWRSIKLDETAPNSLLSVAA
jgi:hypothetical protein